MANDEAIGQAFVSNYGRKGKQLVPPLYMVDRARYACIQILVPKLSW